MQWEQCSQLFPLKHETVTASGHRAHVAVLRKAPGGICDPAGITFSFLDLHKYVPTTQLIPSLAAKTNRTGISNGTRLDLPPHRVSCVSRGWEGHCCSWPHLGCSGPWCQRQHLTDPRKELSIHLQMWARSEISVSHRRDDADVLEILHPRLEFGLL